MGACNLLCGIAVGISGSNAALADAADSCEFRIWLSNGFEGCLSQEKPFLFEEEKKHLEIRP